jgi:hypothetical protein
MCVCRKGVGGNVINKYEMVHEGRDQSWHNDDLSYSNMHQRQPAELIKRGPRIGYIEPEQQSSNVIK